MKKYITNIPNELELYTPYLKLWQPRNKYILISTVTYMLPETIVTMMVHHHPVNTAVNVLICKHGSNKSKVIYFDNYREFKQFKDYLFNRN